MEVREGGGGKMQFCFEDAEDHMACCVGGCHEGSKEVLRGCDWRGVLERGAIEDRIFRYLVITDELIPAVRGLVSTDIEEFSRIRSAFGCLRSSDAFVPAASIELTEQAPWYIFNFNM